ncbi:transporter substrate-binding domain-containing protein [Streptomyces aureus]
MAVATCAGGGLLPRKHLAPLGAMTVAAALTLTGCSDQSPKDPPPSPSGTGTRAPLYEELPAAVKKSGVIKVGSDMLYPPMEFIQNGKPTGVDPGLAEVLGRELGVRFQFANSAFDTLLTGLRAKRYDVVMSAMSDTKERQQGLDPSTGEKIGEDVDFVDYFTAGSSIMVKKGNPEKIRTPADLCGRKVAVQSGSTAYDLLQSQQCDEPIDIEAYDTHDEAQARWAPVPRWPMSPTTRRSPTRRRPRAAARTSRWSVSRSGPVRTASRCRLRTTSCGTRSRRP